MNASHILHESGPCYGAKTGQGYSVFRPAKSRTHCFSESSYPLTDDGLSIAKARCDYLGGPTSRGPGLVAYRINPQPGDLA